MAIINNLLKNPLVIIGLIILIIVIFALLAKKKGDQGGIIPSDKGDQGGIIPFDKDLATCLREKGVKLYGGRFCGRTKYQRQMFGNSINNLPYVECENSDRSMRQECLNVNIRKYPLWIFPDGRRIEGRIVSFGELAQYSGCPIPATMRVIIPTEIPDARTETFCTPKY